MASEAKVEKHPSYGMIGISHVSSTGTRLFGSEFQHQHFLTLRISRAERKRDLARDWYFAHEHVIEVELSEAQFCELITRTNMGDGVPCTIRWEDGKGMIEEPPAPPTIQERFTADMKADTASCVKDLRDAITELNAAIKSGNIGKTVLKEISGKLQSAACAVDRGIPFVEESFREEMENTVRHAAVEIEATVANIAMRLGVEKMREISDSQPQLLLRRVED